MTDLSRLSAVLRAERDRLNLTDSALARRADVRQSVVYDLLSGTTADPRLATVCAVLAGLGRSLSWLDRELAGKDRGRGC